MGGIIQIIIFTFEQNYRKRPCVFYFLVAALHDIGQLSTGLLPFIVNSYYNIDINRTSKSWCKMRLFFASSFSAISLSCACLATLDQVFITCRISYVRQWSNMKSARCTCLAIMFGWWLHSCLWIVFRDISPMSGLCTYTNMKFFLYAILFVLVILDTLHMSAMVIFALLCYRNIHRSIALSRRQIDRQMIRVIYTQTVLTLTSTIPYGIFVTYTFLTADARTRSSNRDGELLGNAITYTLSCIAYGVSDTISMNLIIQEQMSVYIFRVASMPSYLHHLDFAER